MSETLFVGVDARTPALFALTAKLREDPAALKVPRDDGLHLTLRYLGKRDDPADIEAALTGLRFAPFDLELEGLGTFGGRSPRVLWAGVKGEAAKAKLRALADAVDARLAPLTGGRDRPLAPHVTLARPRGSGAALTEIARSARERALGAVEVREVLLYASRAAEGGPNRYVPIARFPG